MQQPVKKNLSLKTLCTLFLTVILICSAIIPASAQTADNEKNTVDQILSVLGLTYDHENKTLGATNGTGLLGTGFDYDFDQNVFFASNNCWQRNFGYSTFYDDLSHFALMDFDCLRFYFDYNGKSWLIEAWKGQYGITTGCELGIYYKSPDREIKHYDCVSDEDMLPLSVSLSRKGENLFVREMEYRWWQTGFALLKFIPAQELVMDFSIKFPNKEMLNAFTGAITDDMNIEYSISSTTFNCKWLETPVEPAEETATQAA